MQEASEEVAVGGQAETRPLRRRRQGTSIPSTTKSGQNRIGAEDAEDIAGTDTGRTRRKIARPREENTPEPARTAGKAAGKAVRASALRSPAPVAKHVAPAPESEPDTSTPQNTNTRITTPSKHLPPVPPDGMHTMDGRPAHIPQAPPRPTSRNLDPSQLYRGRARMALLRDLAMGEWSDRSIADSVGVPVEIITDFRETYENEIQEVRAALAGQLAIESAGLWISKRHNRISELQSDFEDIDLVIDVMRKNTRQKLEENALTSGSDSMVKGDVFDTDLLLGSRRHQNLLRSKIAILKAVADEYAPNRQKKEDQEDNTIRYVIESDGAGDSTDILESLT